jgi:hypothetical protein
MNKYNLFIIYILFKGVYTYTRYSGTQVLRYSGTHSGTHSGTQNFSIKTKCWHIHFKINCVHFHLIHFN